MSPGSTTSAYARGAVTGPLTRLARLPPRQLVVVTAVGTALLVTCFFAPRFWLWRALGVPLTDLVSIQPELNRAFYELKQLADPWQKIDDVTNRVIEWRLLFPMLAHWLGLPPAVFFALPHVGCLLALGATAGYAWRSTQSAAGTFFATLLVATCSWFFVSSGWLGYFDSWLVLALLLASFGRSRWVLFGAALLAPWIDERFILALPLIAGLRASLAPVDSAEPRGAVWRDAAALLAGIAPYVAIRLGAELNHARDTSTSYWAHRSLLPAPVWAMVLGLWHGLRLGWIAVGIAVAAWARQGRWFALAAIAAGFVLNVCVADDVSRSVSIAVPVVLASVLVWWRTAPERARQWWPLLCAGNLLLPTQHVIAMPLSAVEGYHCVPVLSLPAEIARSSEPPYYASAFVYNQIGMNLYSGGDGVHARSQLEVALRFEPDFAKAHANHGIVVYLQGERDAGMAELTHALDAAPWLYEARMQRAAFRGQAGDLKGALDDVQLALRDMPGDWARRKQAEQFAQALAAQIAAGK
jgi:hypothetical protein